MSTMQSAEPGKPPEPGPASTNALIESAFDVEGLPAIDRRIATLRERILATSPRFTALVPSYWAEIDDLLELRLWLTRAARA